MSYPDLSLDSTDASFIEDLRVSPYHAADPLQTEGSGTVNLLSEGVVSLFGVKTATDEVMFVDQETAGTETRTADLQFAGKRRYLGHARKIKGILRRAHRSETRELNGLEGIQWVSEDCVFPDRPCAQCVDCYDYGSFNPDAEDQPKTNARVRMHDMISVETFDRNRRFRARHPDEQDEDPTPFQEVVVPPGTNFVYSVKVFAPTLSTLAGFLWANEIADTHGYGSYTATRGEFETTWLALSEGIPEFSKYDAITTADDHPDTPPVDVIEEYVAGLDAADMPLAERVLSIEDSQAVVDELLDWFDRLQSSAEEQ